MDHSRGRVAIIYPWPNLETVAPLRNAAILLTEHGYRVEFYVLHDDAFPAPSFDNPAISVITDRPQVFTKAGIVLPAWTGGRGGTPYSWLVSRLYRPLWRRFRLDPLMRQRHAANPYTCFIGIDPEGLVDAAPLAELLDVPLIYWSLELLFADEAETAVKKALKRKEIVHSRQAAFSIIQDEWRARALITENGLPEDKVVLVPNAPRGNARRSQSSFLQHRLGIRPDKKVMLYAGTIRWWAMTREIVEVATKWPEEYVLVVHSRLRSYRSGSEYVERVVAAADSDRIIISFDPVSAEEYQLLVDSADVGLAFYNPYLPRYSGTNKNLYIMGLSSGKLAHYLQSGLPVVTNETIGPRDLVQEYNCGISVSRPDEISQALETIFPRYDQYAANACRCFDERLEFESHFDTVLKCMERMTSQ